VSRSYKNEVPQPNKEQSHKNFKKQHNKKLRQNVKKVLEGFISGEVDRIKMEEVALEEKIERN
jgi:hypothetical protein